MKTRMVVVIVALILTVFIIGFSGIGVGEPHSDDEQELGYIVHVEGDTSADSIEESKQIAEELQQPVIEHVESLNGTEVKATFWSTNNIHITVDEDQTSKEEILNHSAVERMSENQQVETPDPGETDTGIGIQSTPDEGPTYGLEQIRTEETWEQFDTTGDGVNVTVLDTGADITHPDISLGGDESNNYEGYWVRIRGDGVEEGTDAPEPYDAGSHGTHVAGTVLGGDANSEDVQIGVAPNATGMHGKVLGERFGSTTDVAAGVEWAIENNADVISLSLGSEEQEDALSEHIEEAWKHDIVVIASSGNSGPNELLFPAGEEDSIAVGATDSDEEVWEGSSGWADEDGDVITPDIVAPGVDVWSAEEGSDGVTRKTGTSMSAPHVSGIAALALSNNPELTPDEFRMVLTETAHPIDSFGETRQGSGIVDAYATLQATNPDGYYDTGTVLVNESVEAGDTLLVNTTITNKNIIDEYGKQNVSLYVDDERVDVKEDVEIASEDSTDVEFEHETSKSDAGETNVSIRTDTTEGTNTTDVEGVPNFEVDVNESDFDDGVVVGEENEFSVDVNNTGGEPGEEPVKLFVNDEEKEDAESETIELAAGEETSVDIAYTPVEDELGEATFRVESSTTSDEVVTDVLEPAEFSVELLEDEIRDEEFVIGETVPVNATVENTGGVNESSDVELLINESVQSEATENTGVLESGESVQVSLPYTVGVDDYAESNVSVRTNDSEQNTVVDVLRPGESSVSIENVNEPVEGEDIIATVDVENVGDVNLSQVLDVGVDGVGENETEIAVENDTVEQFDIRIPTTEGDAGEYTVDAETPDSADSGDVSVLTGPEFEVELINSTTPVTAGENVSLNTSVENVGGETGEETVTLTTDSFGDVEQSRSVELGAGEEETIQFEFETGVDDIGEQTVLVGVGDSEVSEQVVVDEPVKPEVSGVNVSESVSNDVLTVNGTVSQGGVNVSEVDIGVEAGFTSFSFEEQVAEDVDEGGEFEVTIDVDDLVGDGEYTSVIRVTDDAGQEVTATGEEARVDTTAPTVQLSANDVETDTGEVVVEADEAFEVTDVEVIADTGDDRSPDSSSIPDGFNSEPIEIPFDSSETSGDGKGFSIGVEAEDEVGNSVSESFTTNVSGYEVEDGSGELTVSDRNNISVDVNESEFDAGEPERQAMTGSGSGVPAGTALENNVLSGGYLDVSDIGLSESELSNATLRIDVDKLDSEAIEGFDSDELTLFKSEDGERGYTEIEAEYDSNSGELVTEVDGFSQFVAGGVDSTPPEITDVDVTPGEDVDSDDGPVTVTFEYSEENSPINVSETSITADVGSERVTNQVTEDDAELTVDDLSEGETITVEMIVTDTAGNVAEKEVTIEVGGDGDDDSGNGGNGDDDSGSGGSGGSGGGGGGGGGSGSGVPSPLPTQFPDDASVDERTQDRISGSESVSVAESGSFLDGPVVREVRFNEGGLEGDIETRDYDRVPSEVGSPPGEAYSVTQILVPPEYTDIDSTVQFDLMNAESSPVDVEEMDRDSLTVWHRSADNGDWESLETEVVEDSEEHLIVEAGVDSFSYFVVTDASDHEDEREDGAGDEEDSVMSDDTPGFGVIVALVAIMLSVIVLRLRQ